MTRIGIPVFLCLVTLSLFLPQRALAQIYVFGGTCSGSLLSLERSIRTGDIAGQNGVSGYEIRKPSGVPENVLQSGETYQVSYEIYPSCGNDGGAVCGVVSVLDLSLRQRVGNVFPSALNSSTEQDKFRMNRQDCNTSTRVSLRFRAPVIRADTAKPGAQIVTAGVCPPNAKFPCTIHRIRVAPVEPHAGWEVSGVRLNTSSATAGVGFSVNAQITNQTGRGAWPGGRATMWVYPPLSRTPQRIETREVPSLNNGESYPFRANVPGVSAGRHMFQACFGPTGETAHETLKCGPRSAIRVQ